MRTLITCAMALKYKSQTPFYKEINTKTSHFRNQKNEIETLILQKNKLFSLLFLIEY